MMLRFAVAILAVLLVLQTSEATKTSSSVLVDTSPLKSVSDQLRILIIAPFTKLLATHFQWHYQLASKIAEDPEIEPHLEYIYLLGLVEELEDVKDEEKKGKIVVWKYTRFGPMMKDPNLPWNYSGKPLKNVWRNYKSFMPDRNGGPKDLYLNFILNNKELMDDLRAKDFNVGITESIDLDALEHGIFHFLPSIKVTMVTCSVQPTMSHYHGMGYDKIVHEVPGLNTAYVGIHDEVNNKNFGPIYGDNMIWVDEKARVAKETYNLWLQKLRQSENVDPARVESLPIQHALFKQAKYLLVNQQPMVDYKLVENEINKINHEHKGVQLAFIGGIGLFMPNGNVNVKQELAPQTKEIFNKHHDSVILVSLGSVVELGVHGEEVSADEFEDSEKKTEAFLEVFKEFERYNGKQIQFIMKYGDKTKLGANQRYIRNNEEGEEDGELQSHIEFPENVHAKGWLEQRAILAHKPAAFISHCGANSVLEALAFGVPLICIPFFGDQFNNAEALASRKMAVVIDALADLRDTSKNEQLIKEKPAHETIEQALSKNINHEKEHTNERFKAALKVALRKVLGNENEESIYKKNMEEARKKFLEAHPIQTLRNVFAEIMKDLGIGKAKKVVHVDLVNHLLNVKNHPKGVVNGPHGHHTNTD